MVSALLKLVVYLLAQGVVLKVTVQKAASKTDLSIGHNRHSAQCP